MNVKGAKNFCRSWVTMDLKIERLDIASNHAPYNPKWSV